MPDFALGGLLGNDTAGKWAVTLISSLNGRWSVTVQNLGIDMRATIEVRRQCRPLAGPFVLRTDQECQDFLALVPDLLRAAGDDVPVPMPHYTVEGRVHSRSVQERYRRLASGGALRNKLLEQERRIEELEATRFYPKRLPIRHRPSP